MTPEYLEELADLADPGQLWRLRGLEQLDLPADKRRQLDTGVALRRHASHIRQLDALRKEGRSLLLTPLSLNGTAMMGIDTPPEHARLRDANARPEVPALHEDMREVPCAVRDDGWLYIPHASGQWVTAAKLQPFSMEIVKHWRAEQRTRGVAVAGHPTKTDHTPMA